MDYKEIAKNEVISIYKGNNMYDSQTSELLGAILIMLGTIADILNKPTEGSKDHE